MTAPTLYKLGSTSTRPDEHGQSVSYPAMVVAAHDDPGPLYVLRSDVEVLAAQLATKEQRRQTVLVCGCGEQHPVDSRGGGFIAATGHCEACSTAQRGQA